MPAMNVEVPHSLGKDAAIAHLQSLMEKIQEHYKDQVKDIQQSWEGDTLNFSFKTFGMTISGTLVVGDDKVTMNGKLPIAAMAFRGQIEGGIRQELEKQLAG
jgi:putative polyhydroxyalkanoate system protein